MPINFNTMHKIASAGGKWAKFTGLDLRSEGNKKVANIASLYIESYSLNPYDAWLSAMQDYIDVIPDDYTKNRYALGMIAFLRADHNINFSESNVLEIERRSKAILNISQHDFNLSDTEHGAQRNDTQQNVSQESGSPRGDSQKSDWEKDWVKNSSSVANCSRHKKINRVNPWLANITMGIVSAIAVRYFGLVGGIPVLAICYFVIGKNGRKYMGSNTSLVFILVMSLIIMVALQYITMKNEQQQSNVRFNEKLQDAVNTLNKTKNDSNPQFPPVDPLPTGQILPYESTTIATPSEQDSPNDFQYEPPASNEKMQPQINNIKSQLELFEEAKINGGNLDPIVKSKFQPDYPRAAVRAAITGTVLVEITLDNTGKVIDASIFKSSRNKDLDRSALTSVRKWTFYPKIENGLPVNATALITIDFTF